jgi:hypothetical protein
MIWKFWDLFERYTKRNFKIPTSAISTGIFEIVLNATPKEITRRLLI